MLDDLYKEHNEINPNEPETDPNEEYHFANGELAPSEQLDAFIEEFAVPKEEKDAPDEPTPEELAELDEPENEDEISNETARNTAQFIVSTIDESASIGLAYLSKDDQDNFRAGREQRKNLENLFTKFCKEKGTEIPLPWQIFFCLATIYGAKIPYALDRRQLNNEIETIRRQKEELEQTRRDIDRERQAIEAERQTIRSLLKEKTKNDGKQ